MTPTLFDRLHIISPPGFEMQEAVHMDPSPKDIRIQEQLLETTAELIYMWYTLRREWYRERKWFKQQFYEMARKKLAKNGVRI